MARPDIVFVFGQIWAGNDGVEHWRREYEIIGGEVAAEWAARLRPPLAPWCRIAIYDSNWSDVPREHGGGTYLSSYGGEVWPTAWPELFEERKRYGNGGVRLTEAGEAWFAAAISSKVVR